MAVSASVARLASVEVPFEDQRVARGSRVPCRGLLLVWLFGTSTRSHCGQRHWLSTAPTTSHSSLAWSVARRESGL